MYNARMEVILRHIVKTKEVNLYEINKIYNSKIEEVMGLYFEYSVINIPRTRRSPKSYLESYRKDLLLFEESFCSIISNLSVDDYAIELLDCDKIPAGFFSFCSYYFGDINVKAILALEIFIIRCRSMQEEINRVLENGDNLNLYYSVNDFNLDDIMHLSKVMNKKYFIEDGIKLILEFLSYNEKRNFLFLIIQLCKQYRLLEARRDRFKFVGYFNENLLDKIK